MPAPWIKIEVTLPDKEEVVEMGNFLKMKDADLVVGKLIRLWAWADQQTVDGSCMKITCAFIDRLVCCKGFANALMSVGWLEGKDRALIFPRFERHNGETTKERIGTNRRVSKHRNKKNGAGVTGKGEKAEICNGESVSNVAERGGICNGKSVTNVTKIPLPNPLPEEDIEFNNKGGSREIPQCMGETPSRDGFSPSSPPPPVFPDQVKGADGKLLPEFVEFVEWAKGVRPGWDVGRLSRREQKAAAQAFLTLQRPVSELERMAVTEYLAHEPESGGKFDYPPDRELFFSLFQETVQKAVTWFRKTGRKTPAEREEARKRTRRLKLRNEEGMARRLAKQFRHSPEEVVEELNALRRKYEEKPLNENELEKIMKGDYDV